MDVRQDLAQLLVDIQKRSNSFLEFKAILDNDYKWVEIDQILIWYLLTIKDVEAI